MPELQTRQCHLVDLRKYVSMLWRHLRRFELTVRYELRLRAPGGTQRKFTVNRGRSRIAR